MGHLWNFSETNYDNIVLTTIEVIRNINKVLCNTNKEIILAITLTTFRDIFTKSKNSYDGRDTTKKH